MRKEAFNQLEIVFKDVLGLHEISLSDQTVAQDIPHWDSLNHIRLVVAIEKKFKVRFTSKQIGAWRNMGDMVTDLVKLLKSEA